MDQAIRIGDMPESGFFGGRHRKSNLTHIDYRRGGLAEVRAALIEQLEARRRRSRPTSSDLSRASGQGSG
jgi:hypothetical protein